MKKPKLLKDDCTRAICRKLDGGAYTVTLVEILIDDAYRETKDGIERLTKLHEWIGQAIKWLEVQK